MMPHVFSIGPFTLHTYGLLVAVGFLLGYVLAQKEFRRQGLPVTTFDHVATVLILGGIFGARLFYFLFVVRSAFFEDPWSFFRIWEGGLVFYGGLVMAIVGLVVYARRKKIPFLLLGDMFAIPLLLSQAIGRLGCFAAGCCYGGPTTSIFGVTFTHPDSLAPLHVALHPTQIYAAMGNFLLFVVGYLISRRQRAQGVLMVYYLMGYGLFRFFVEFLRNDMRGPFLFQLSPSQWVSLGLMAAGWGVWIYAKKKSQTR